MPWWKRFLAASLLAFSAMLFSCNSHINGEPVMVSVKTDSVQPPPPSDNQTLGLTEVIDTPQAKKPACVKPTIVDTLGPEIMGEVAIQPQETKSKN